MSHAYFEIGDIPYYLRHPFLMRIRSDSRDVDLECAQMDEEKDVIRDQSEARPHFGGEEIGCHRYIHVASDELTPRCFLLRLGNRWQTVFPKYISNRCVAYPVSQVF